MYLRNHSDKYIIVQVKAYRINDSNNMNIEKLFPKLDVEQLL